MSVETKLNIPPVSVYQYTCYVRRSTFPVHDGTNIKQIIKHNMLSNIVWGVPIVLYITVTCIKSLRGSDPGDALLFILRWNIHSIQPEYASIINIQLL